MRTGIVIASAVVAVVLWFALHDRSRSTARKTPPTEAPKPVAVSPTTPPTLPKSDEPDETDPMPVVDATHMKMQEIGRQCFNARTPREIKQGEYDDTVGRLELKLAVHVTQHSARVDSAEVVTTRHLRDDIRDCIVAASKTATWPVEAADGTTEIVELFRMGDFVAIPSPDSPPSAPPTR